MYRIEVPSAIPIFDVSLDNSFAIIAIENNKCITVSLTNLSISNTFDVISDLRDITIHDDKAFARDGRGTIFCYSKNGELMHKYLNQDTAWNSIKNSRILSNISKSSFGKSIINRDTFKTIAGTFIPANVYAVKSFDTGNYLLTITNIPSLLVIDGNNKKQNMYKLEGFESNKNTDIKFAITESDQNHVRFIVSIKEVAHSYELKNECLEKISDEETDTIYSKFDKICGKDFFNGSIIHNGFRWYLANNELLLDTIISYNSEIFSGIKQHTESSSFDNISNLYKLLISFYEPSEKVHQNEAKRFTSMLLKSQSQLSREQIKIVERTIDGKFDEDFIGDYFEKNNKNLKHALADIITSIADINTGIDIPVGLISREVKNLFIDSGGSVFEKAVFESRQNTHGLFAMDAAKLAAKSINNMNPIIETIRALRIANIKIDTENQRPDELYDTLKNHKDTNTSFWSQVLDKYASDSFGINFYYAVGLLASGAQYDELQIPINNLERSARAFVIAKAISASPELLSNVSLPPITEAAKYGAAHAMEVLMKSRELYKNLVRAERWDVLDSFFALPISSATGPTVLNAHYFILQKQQGRGNHLGELLASSDQKMRSEIENDVAFVQLILRNYDDSFVFEVFRKFPNLIDENIERYISACINVERNSSEKEKGALKEAINRVVSLATKSFEKSEIDGGKSSDRILAVRASLTLDVLVEEMQNKERFGDFVNHNFAPNLSVVCRILANGAPKSRLAAVSIYQKIGEYSKAASLLFRMVESAMHSSSDLLDRPSTSERDRIDLRSALSALVLLRALVSTHGDEIVIRDANTRELIDAERLSAIEVDLKARIALLSPKEEMKSREREAVARLAAAGSDNKINEIARELVDENRISEARSIIEMSNPKSVKLLAAGIVQEYNRKDEVAPLWINKLQRK